MNIKDDQVYFIAEIGSNHNQDIDRLADLIYGARSAGFDAIKMQMFNADKLYSPDIEGYQDIIDTLRGRELSNEMFSQSKAIANQAGIEFGVSVFDVGRFDWIKDLPGIDFFKVSSFDILRKDFIERIVSMGKPTVISLGCGPKELLPKHLLIIDTVYLLHCISLYPSPLNCHLGRIWEDNLDGWSDHSREPGIIMKAIEVGAKIIEMHIDLPDFRGNESDHGHCWNIEIARQLIDNVRIGEKGMEKLKEDYYSEVAKHMADPSDGLRPLKELR